MDKRFLGILAVIVIIFIAIFAITQSSNSGSSGSKNSNAQATNHVEGQNKAGITFVEYGDYECPICEAYYQPLKQGVSQYLDQIHFQFRNLPLTSIHQNAFAAARAAEAASLQGKFWQMHDKLYENQQAWVTSSSPIDQFTTYAQQIGLNVNQFKTDYSSNQVNDSINADMAAFKKTGQEQATPTFFVNGKFIANTQFSDPQTGAPTADKIASFLKSEIDKKTSQNK